MVHQTSQTEKPVFLLTPRQVAIIAYRANLADVKPQSRLRVLAFQARVNAMLDARRALTGRRPKLLDALEAMINFGRADAALRQGDVDAALRAILEEGARA